MSMVINTNVQAIRTHGVYNTNNTAMNEAMTRVATGMKVSSAKDNASVWAITQRMRDRIRANDQANQNVQNDSALIRTAQGGIDNTVSILTTLKERAINAANDSNLNLDRGAIATEVEQLALQIDDNATKVKFNGRFLLNGAEDTTVANFNGAASKANSSSTIVEPTAATMPASSATTRGSHAVYKLINTDSFVLKSSGNAASTASIAATNLTDLYSLASHATGTALTDADRAFKVGDTITFSWKENGEEKSYSYNVKSDSKIGDLAFNQDHLKVAYYASSSAAQALTSKDTVSADQSVKDSSATAVSTTAGAGNDGLFAIGDKGVTITDFKVAVTYNDELNDNKLTTRTQGQEAMKFTGVQQVSGADTASNAVFKMTSGSSGAGTPYKIDKDSYVSSFLDGYVTNLAADDKVTFSIGDKSVTVQGNTKMEDLQSAFADKGINMVLVQNTVDVQLKDVNGNFVVPDDADKQVYAATKTGAATTTDVYFVGEKGEALSGLKITAVSNDLQTERVTAGAYASSDTKSLEATAIYKIKEDSDTAAAAAASNGSTPLTFHIGGEQDFAIDVTIEKMTVDNLFAQKDTNGNVTQTYDAKSFATLFTDKDGAKVAMGLIDNALNTALAEQTKLGAIENRLGYTSDNLTTMNENLEAANSAYRDSDIAKEMTQYMKYAVLSQASQYMLSQASQNAYSILNLLQA